MVDLEALERPKRQPLGFLRQIIHQIRPEEEKWSRIYGFDSPETEEFTAWYEPDGRDDLVVIQPPRSQRDLFVESWVSTYMHMMHRLDIMYTWVC